MTKKSSVKSQPGIFFPEARGWRMPAPGLVLVMSLMLFLWVMGAPRAHAHHGRDFILIQDSAIPAQFGGVVIAGYQWSRDGDEDFFSSEPGFYIGLAPALAFGLTAGFSDDGNGWQYTGVTPQFVLSLLGPSGPRNVRVGLWAGYEFAESSSLSSGTRALPPGGGNGNGGGPDARSLAAAHTGPVALHAGGHGSVQSGQDNTSGRGINRHGESGLYSRFIVEADLATRTRAIANLISFVPDGGGKAGFGYAAGVRYEVNHDLSLGVEALGEFLSYGSSHEVLLTTMIGLPGHLSFRLGVGGGLTRSSPDFTLSTSFLLRF